MFNYLFIFLIFIFNVYSTEKNSSLDIVEKVEKNLIYSKDIVKEKQDNNVVVIQKGKWSQEDTKELESITEENKKIKTEIKKSKDDKTIITLKRKAFDAIEIKQYEVAVKLYKDVLKINKNDVYAKLGLATAYQYLGQYLQAKPLYLDVLQVFPDNQQVIANLLSIIMTETPYESIYFLSNIAEKNKNSSVIQAQTSLAYTRINNYNKAIEYIKRAIELDNTNLEYQYNLAVLYDKNNNINEAIYSYTNLLNNVSNYDTSYSFSIKEIQERLNYLRSKNG